MKINIEDEIIVYCRENNLQLLTVFNTIETEIEKYFEKKIYFDETMTPRFVINDKKVTISQKLEKFINNSLLLLSKTKKNQYSVGTVISARIVAFAKNGFFLKSNDGFDCYLNKKFRNNLNIGDIDYFTVYKIVKNKIYLRRDIKTIEFLINKILIKNVEVVKYIPNKLIVFNYYDGDKKSINLKLLKTYFKEKIIYNKKDRNG